MTIPRLWRMTIPRLSARLIKSGRRVSDVDCVFHADPHVAARDIGLREHRECGPADAKASPGDTRRQAIAGVQHRLRVSRKAVTYAEHQRRHRRRAQRSVGEHFARVRCHRCRTARFPA